MQPCWRMLECTRLLLALWQSMPWSSPWHACPLCSSALAMLKRALGHQHTIHSGGETQLQ